MTLVIDASAAAEILLGTARGRALAPLLGDHHLIAPDHFAVEVASVIRGWALSAQVSEEQALQAFVDLEDLGVEQVPAAPMLPSAFELRHNFSTYDALYVVLAGRIGCRLLTLDARLASNASDCAMGLPM